MSQTWRQDSLDGALWKSMFYTEYTTVRTAITTPIVLVFMFVVLRAAGSRTLTQATMFNKMLAVAIGSLVGSVALRPNSPLTATVIATFIIVGSALVVDLAYAYGIIPPGLVHVKPVLLYANGRILHKELRRCLIIPEKLASEVRSKGYSSMSHIHSVVLEPTGTFSIITHDNAKEGLELLTMVEGYKPNLFSPAGPDEADVEQQQLSKANGHQSMS